MKSLRVAILAADLDQRAFEQQVENTGMARTVHVSAALPRAAQEPALLELQKAKPDVVLIAIPEQASAAIECIELLRYEVPAAVLVPVGEPKPQVIVTAMRAGAGEFLEYPLKSEQMRDAFARAQAQLEGQNSGNRAKVICFVNAKGGSGATTIAVNTAASLANESTPVLLIDLASPGGASLHLNVNPRFTLADAFRSFQRLDWALVQTILTDCNSGLQLLAGADEPLPSATAEELHSMMDVLAPHFRYIVVDNSRRFDAVARTFCEFSDRVVLVAQPEVGGLWSAAKVRKFLAASCDEKRIGLLLNRYRKVPGLENEQIEGAVGCKVLWTIQNQYISISRSIEKGVPVARDRRSEMSRVFADLATMLVDGRADVPIPEPKPVRNGVFDRITATRSFSFGGAGN